MDCAFFHNLSGKKVGGYFIDEVCFATSRRVPLLRICLRLKLLVVQRVNKRFVLVQPAAGALPDHVNRCAQQRRCAQINPSQIGKKLTNSFVPSISSTFVIERV